MKETGPENRTSKENREGKAGNREGRNSSRAERFLRLVHINLSVDSVQRHNTSCNDW